ncbi:NAD-dependent epimerase/dehydratase family protein [Fibrisoma montanum]|uniref:NAD-dependent epimerase/dehydratase family protein n=1 Tax=Fibrisoma montanum TaxID=2305895 RepID=A0A418MEC0_9BACT|nr:NmrA family NAD(P)-binding protein [Fibrisoma montanum]RIV25154.1 NAD-dependent epimerase/dehydratase family protein [Fibrisoma montanum]
MQRTIAVIGATGMLGRPVTDQFIKAGFTVRIVARDVVKTRRQFPQTEVVPGDLANPASLVDALRDVDVVYLNLSVKQDEKPADFHTETDGLTNLIQVARQVGVKRIGYLSSIIMRYQGTNGFHWWVFDIKQEAVRLIKTSGIPYSIFYPSCFMDSLFYTQKQGSRILMAGRSPVRPWYVAGSDYGRQVAKAFQKAADGQNQEYVIQGPEALTQHEAAERFVAAYPKEKLTVTTAPHWIMRLAGTFARQMDYGAHITEALNKYPEEFEAGATWADLGEPRTTIEQFAKSL